MEVAVDCNGCRYWLWLWFLVVLKDFGEFRPVNKILVSPVNKMPRLQLPQIGQTYPISGQTVRYLLKNEKKC